MQLVSRWSLALVVLVCSACSRDWSGDDSDAGDAGGDAVISTQGPESTPETSPTLGKSEPTLGGIATVGEPRRNAPEGPGSLLLQDDGFELGETRCTSDGACLSGAITP